MAIHAPLTGKLQGVIANALKDGGLVVITPGLFVGLGSG